MYTIIKFIFIFLYNCWVKSIYIFLLLLPVDYDISPPKSLKIKLLRVKEYP